MKYLTAIFAALLASVLVPHFTFAQGAIVVIDGSGAELTSDCQPYNGSNALPDGTPVRIYWDQDEDGPETTDPMLTMGTGVGEWNYNQFVINGASALGVGGTFFAETALLSNGRVLGPGGTYQVRIFLAIMQPNGVDFRWTTLTRIIGNGYNFWKPDINSGDWVCQASSLPGEDCGSINMIDSLPFFDTGNTSGYTDNFNALGNTSPDVIYSFVAPDSGMYLISLCGSSYNTLLEVRTGGACPGDTAIAVDDNGCQVEPGDTADVQSSTVVGLFAGVEYFVIVDGYGATGSGEFTLEVDSARPCPLPAGAVARLASPSPDSRDRGLSVAVDCDGTIYYTDGFTTDRHVGDFPWDDPPYYLFAWQPWNGSLVSRLTTCIGALPGAPSPPVSNGTNILIEEMVWDRNRGQLWGASSRPYYPAGCGYGACFSSIWLVNPVTGGCTFAFYGSAEEDGWVHTDGIAYDPVNNWLWTHIERDQGIVRWNVAPGSEGQLLGGSPPWGSLPGNAKGISVSPSGIYVSFYDSPHTINNYDRNTGQLRGSIAASGAPCLREGLECDRTQRTVPGTVLWCREWDGGTQRSYFVAYRIPDDSCSACSFGRCCYCDSTAGLNPKCAMTTQQACLSRPNSVWSAGLTCADPCSLVLPPPSNDNCSGSRHITACPYLDTGNTCCANPDYVNCVEDPAIRSRDVVYDLNLPAALYVTASLCGTSFDTGIQVMTGGNCPGLFPVACDDDFCNPGFGVGSQVTFAAAANIPYYIIVHSYTDANNNSCGDYVLNVTCTDSTAQCCYCDSMGVTQCAMTTSAACQQLSGIWTWGLTCNDPCPMIPGIDIDSPAAQAVTCSSGVILPNPYLVSANIYNHRTITCQDVSVSLAVSGSYGVTGTVLNSPIYLGNMSGQTGSSVAFDVQLSGINPGGAIICYVMVTQSLGCCNDSVFICDTIPPCPCPYDDRDFEYPEPGVPISMDNDSCNTFGTDCPMTSCGEINPVGDVDWYPIYTFGAPCVRLIVNVYGNDTPLQFPFGKGLNPKIQLYHNDCVSQIAWDDNAGVGNDSYLSACLPAGDYRIRVTGVGNTMGPYILTTDCLPCTCSASCDEACDHQLTSLQNWWQLDELSGTTANEGVNQRDGSWVNSPVPQPGKVGPSLRFNGTNYVTVPSHPLVETGSNSFSLDAWINIDNYPIPALPMPIAGKTDASGKGFLLYIDILGYLAGWVKDGNVAHDLIAIDPVVVPPGWHLVTMTFTKHDATHPNDVLTLYRCGNVVQQLTAPTNLGPFTNTAPFEIANTQFPFFAKFMGRIDEVELWRRDLRQDEVQALCNSDSLGKCKEFCHLPWDRYLCMFSNTVTVGVTLCNFTAYAQTYNWTVSGVTPYTWQCPYVPPVGYSWNPIWGPPTPSVAPGTCVTIPLTITAPPGLGFNDVSCYQVNFTSSSGKSFCCQGSIWGRRKWCFHLNEWETSPLSVRVGGDTTYTFEVTNEADSSGVLAYTLEVMSPDPLLLGCRINGLPPGENFEGTLEVPLGQTAQLPVTLQMAEDQPLIMYDLMIGWDESGDGVPEFPLSINLRSLDEQMAPQSPLITAIRSTGPGEIRLDWDLDPFATSYNVYKSDTSPNGPWTLLGTTSLNSFVDVGAVASQFKRFYQVTSVDSPGDSLRVPQGGIQQK